MLFLDEPSVKKTLAKHNRQIDFELRSRRLYRHWRRRAPPKRCVVSGQQSAVCCAWYYYCGPSHCGINGFAGMLKEICSDGKSCSR